MSLSALASTSERRKLNLSDALPGLLHTGTYREDPAEDVTFSRLAVDTGSIVTWIFGEHPTLIQEGNAIERDFVRIGRKGYYTTGATQNPGEHLTIPYLEGSAVRDNTAVQLYGAWSPWILAASSSMHWEINLESLVIGDETNDINLKAIIDTGVWPFNCSDDGYLFAGTTYSYLPRAACEFLHKSLGGQGEPSSKSLYARVQQNTTVNFKFSGVHIIRGLVDLLDPRPNTVQGVQGGPSAYGALNP
ncbi:hypothetical protein C8R44DRAFT_892009 [Mycena epipterygia]|nr:hypothetical protein C8R44DRAFT_892009 [Mycena epipterygia]